MRKGACEPCDVCAAHGDRLATGVDAETHGSCLREDDDETHLTLNTRKCHTFVSERILVGLRWHSEEAVVFLSFLISMNQ